MKIYNFDQRTPEWYDIRKGKMTASHAYTIASNGKGLETYIYSLMSEYYSTNEEEEILTTKDIERGVELEAQARSVFEFETGLTVNEVGFIEVNDYVGVSPDGLTSDNGLTEFKCPKDEIFFRLLCDEKIDPKYIAQMQMQMWGTERNHNYFCAYNPHFGEHSLFIKKVLRDDKYINEKLLLGIETGTKLIQEIKLKFDKKGETNANII